MSRSAKRYYFIQISEEKFFNNVRIKALEKDGGDKVLSFLHLMLVALKDNDPGYIKLDPAFDSMPEQIASMLSCDLDYAEDFYNVLLKRCLCKETEFGLWIPLSKELTASRTEKADEVKKRRAAVKKETEQKKSYVCEDDDEFDEEPEDDSDDQNDDEDDGNECGTKETKCSPYKRTKEVKKVQSKESKKAEPKKVKSSQPKRAEDQSKEPKSIEVNNSQLKNQEPKRTESKKTEVKESNKPRKEESRKQEIIGRCETKEESRPQPIICSSKSQKQNVCPKGKEADSDEEPADLHTFCSKVYGHLKEKIGFEFFHTASNDATIAERRSEGFKLKDFFKIIDLKCSQWLHNSKMRPYLRISTLFGPKMDNYRYEVYCNQNQRSFDRHDDGKINIGGGYYLKDPIMNSAPSKKEEVNSNPLEHMSDFVRRGLGLPLCES